MKKLHILYILLLITGTVFAQVRISGTITDENNLALEGVAVTIKGTTTGLLTDENGKYEITAKKGDVIHFSYVGMVSQSVTVEEATIVNIRLATAAINLEEVVAIGYGVSKKSDLTGAIATVKSENLSNSKIGTVTTALQGLAAGVYVTTGSAKPGGDASIVIRGVGTLNAGSSPLYIVDGVPLLWGLMDLASMDIESIEILKDASAASIYGSRGSNGVVLITTKTGKKGETRISFNASYGIQKMLNKPKMMNAQQFYDLIERTDASSTGRGQMWTSEELRYLSAGRSTDWVDAVTQNGNYQNYNLSISGGSDKLTHYFGVDWYDQAGAIRNSSFQRFTARYNMDNQITGWLKSGLRFNVMQYKLANINEESDSGYGTMFSAISAQPTAPIFTENGEYYDSFPNTRANPVAIVDLLDKHQHKTRVVGSFYIEIEPIKNLTIRSENSGELLWYKDNIFEDGHMGQHYTAGGHARVQASKTMFLQTENIITYKFDLNDKHKFSIMGGFSASGYNYEEFAADAKNLSSIMKYHSLGSAEEWGPDASYANASSLVSFYGRFNYGFNDRYLLTLTMRADGSSRFAPGHRWGYFPSAAVAWRISEEELIKNGAPFISNLKLRLSAGQLGNQNIGEYAYMATIGIGGPWANYIFGDNLATGAVPNTIPNPDLTWEKANQFDLGIDFGFFDNRIAGTIETYYKRTTDLLWSVPLPKESGYTSSLTNVGAIDNKGVEFSINTVNISNKNFLWTTGFNISYNHNEVVELYSGKLDVNKSLFVGHPLSQIYTLHADGMWQQNETAEAARYNCYPGDRKVIDKDENGTINGDDRDFAGQWTPKYYGSLSNTLAYKGFDLNLFFTYAGGHKINNSLEAYINTFNPQGNMCVDYYSNYWMPNRPSNKYPAPRAGSPFLNGDGTDANLQNGDYLRLRNLELGYSLPANLLKPIHASKIRIYFSIQNVFTLTKFTGFDVESSDNTNPYPNSRSFIGGISINF
jgi:TonB-linked SusC/RagA family outer membrane protein